MEARIGTVRVERSYPPPEPDTPSSDRLRLLKPDFSEPFKDLAFIGDDKLNALSRTIVLSLFGSANRKLAKRIQDDWLSNDNWLFLSIVYRLDAFVGLTFQPPSPFAIIHDVDSPLITNSQRQTEQFAFLKAWADLWEAYFGGLIQEREMWGLDMLDLEVFLRRLMIRKYRSLLPCVMNYDVHHTFSAPLRMSLDGMVTKVVGRTHPVVEALFGKARQYGGDLVTPWGHLITYPDKGRKRGVDMLEVPEGPSRRRFGVDAEEALSQLWYGLSEGLEGTPCVPCPPWLLSKRCVVCSVCCLHRLLLSVSTNTS